MPERRPHIPETGLPPETAQLESLRDKDQEEIFKQFTPEQQNELESKRRILSSLAFFIGKDFRIPVELNKPGEGWHWDFKVNKIRIDPKDLLERPMDELRFIISHEGGHRRISRTEFIPQKEWRQPGFAFMINAIEDPRTNNFVAEAYPKFKEQMELVYEHDLDLEQKAKTQAQEKLGHQPRFMQAGFEYIKQWFNEAQGKDMAVSEDLPPDVRQVVAKTLASAQDSWWRYPSRQDADDSEDLIKQYAQLSYEINRDELWPEFKKLVAKDMQDQKTQQFLQDRQQEKAEDDQPSIPQDLQDQLPEELQQELEQALGKALEQTGQSQEEKEEAAEQETEGQGDAAEGEGEGAKEKAGEDAATQGEGTEPGKEAEQPGQPGVPINLDQLSDELKEKLREYIDSLPPDKQQELQAKAQQALQEFEQDLNEQIAGQLTDNPEQKAERQETEEPEKEQEQVEGLVEEPTIQSRKEELNEEEQTELRKKIGEIFEQVDTSPYQEAVNETSNMIDDLTGDLRDIFIKRKIEKTEAGYRYGRRWNVKKRIKEKIAGIPLIKTESREQVENPSEEKDYAITLMIDLSGSMIRGGKIEEAFKSAVVLAETLNNLDIKFEIVGFQDILLEFKSFEDYLGDDIRENLNQLLLEAQGKNPGGHNQYGDNNDGECLLEASKNLAKQQAGNKFLIILSDGAPAMDSGKKSRSLLDHELKEAVKEISKNTDQKLVGLGLLSNAVAKYYENNLPNITTEEMVETLGELLRTIIDNS